MTVDQYKVFNALFSVLFEFIIVFRCYHYFWWKKMYINICYDFVGREELPWKLAFFRPIQLDNWTENQKILDKP